ncbi:hypothetical protein CCMSSC00406_0001812 [Pleurotus cornucopiae]|uniref:Uncharacterized protein n=1 Tax=Pleurotus cornucopiae TaxID=5321 RepID=A0ACB7J391_PLECO|nr:hypothetical protein CCMSSC00406_0001812 [Pleurotus cornucopiae]
MATTVRQPKPTRKGGPSDASRRTPAWSTGARASPTFTPPANFNRPTRTVTPSSQDRILQNLAGLTGTTITLATRTSQRYEGVIGSTGGEGDTTGVTLKDVKELTNPGAPLKDTLFIASTNIDTWTSGPADSKPTTNGDSFKTDVDISQKSQTMKHRELQAWKPSADVPEPSVNFQAGNGDDRTFGVGSNGGWDQFAVNEQLYGVKTQFDEELYTTKLDRSAADFKERERKAQRIANEILGGSTSNPHVAEERNQIVDDSGANEEDKYSTVVRGRDAYVPPGARKPGVTSPPISNAAKTAAEIPKVSINGPDGSSLPSQQEQSSTPSNSSKAPSPAPSNSTKPPADPLPAFRDFVTNEKQRLTQKRQALVKNEMDKRMADLVKFSQNFKLNKPIPDDLVPILAKDEEKQKAIREKASKDAASAQARSIGSVSAAGPAPGARAPTQSSKAFEARKAAAPSTGVAAKTTTGAPAAAPSANQKPSTASAKPNGATETTAGKKTSSMFIQAIPPFKGSKARAPATASVAQPNGSSQQQAAAQASSAAQPQSAVPLSPTSANRLNVGASPFRPNPMASAFKPGAPSSTGASNGSASSVSPKQSKAETTTAPSTPNPFFGPRIIKKNTPVHVKDDFNPFKHNKVAEATSVAALWPYNGKRYMQMFPPPQHPPQQHSPHMGPPGPPPMPPPTYEEDSAAQAAARNQQQQQYIYYPPYGYPPMMPGMVPPGPPGAYVPNPFMQPMPYPPGMPPPGAMYASPSMGQMPPPQAYMQPPPPGTYPLPNGAGPRPSMPPTPIPGHAHPGYYQQSPQRTDMSFDPYHGKMFMHMPTVQHAVPYQMMMPPPGGPNMPPHQYEQGPAPPVQMGGHA